MEEVTGPETVVIDLTESPATAPPSQGLAGVSSSGTSGPGNRPIMPRALFSGGNDGQLVKVRKVLSARFD